MLVGTRDIRRSENVEKEYSSISLGIIFGRIRLENIFKSNLNFHIRVALDFCNTCNIIILIYTKVKGESLNQRNPSHAIILEYFSNIIWNYIFYKLLVSDNLELLSICNFFFHLSLTFDINVLLLKILGICVYQFR